MNNDYDKELKELLWVIKSCAIDYDKREEGMHTFEWSELWVINDYIEELRQKVNQLETNRDELKKWLEEEKNKHYDRKWLSDDELCYRLEDNSAKTLIEVQTKMEILERGKE